jgi:hypothetical protein
MLTNKLNEWFDAFKWIFLSICLLQMVFESVIGFIKYKSEYGLTVDTNNNRQYLRYSLSVKERNQLVIMIATFIIAFIDVFGVCATLLESCSGLIFLSLVLLTMVCAPLLVRFCQNINPLMRSSTLKQRILFYTMITLRFVVFICAVIFWSLISSKRTKRTNFLVKTYFILKPWAQVITIVIGLFIAIPIAFWDYSHIRQRIPPERVG